MNIGEMYWAAVDNQGSILQDQVDLGIDTDRQGVEKLLRSDAWRHRDFKIVRIKIVQLPELPADAGEADRQRQ